VSNHALIAHAGLSNLRRWLRSPCLSFAVAILKHFYSSRRPPFSYFDAIRPLSFTFILVVLNHFRSELCAHPSRLLGESDSTTSSRHSLNLLSCLIKPSETDRPPCQPRCLPYLELVVKTFPLWLGRSFRKSYQRPIRNRQSLVSDDICFSLSDRLLEKHISPRYFLLLPMPRHPLQHGLT
jgi:hypothetical protein